MEKELKLVQEIYPESRIYTINTNVIFVREKYQKRLSDRFSIILEKDYYILLCLTGGLSSVIPHFAKLKDFSKILKVLKAIKECEDD